VREKTIDRLKEKINNLRDREDSIRKKRQDPEAQARNLIAEKEIAR